MEKNKTLVTIDKLLKQHSWTLYRLSQESGIPYSSLNSLYQKNNQPTISTLERICDAFNISMSDFFAEFQPPKTELLSCPAEIKLVELYRSLTPQNRERMLAYVQGFVRTPLT